MWRGFLGGSKCGGMCVLTGIEEKEIVRLRTCSPSHNGAEHHWGFELCCAFYLKLSLCIFFWLKSISKAYCESLFSQLLNHFIALTIKHQNIFMKTKIFFFF